jgi:hypothetical protein
MVLAATESAIMRVMRVAVSGMFVHRATRGVDVVS